MKYTILTIGAGMLLALGSLPGSGPVRAQQPLSDSPGIDPALIGDLVLANRILAREGAFDAYGHVSIRHPHKPDHYFLSRSAAPELVTASDIMEYDLDSTPLEPNGRSSVLERFIHGEIYKARPDVHAVVHSHSAGVIPFGVTKTPLRPVFHMAAFLHVGVPVWDVRIVNDSAAPGLLVRNAALGKIARRNLGGQIGCPDARAWLRGCS